MPIARHLSIRPDESSSPGVVLETMLLPDEHILQTAKISSGIYWQSVFFVFMAVLFMFLAFLFGLPSPLLLLFGSALTIKAVIMIALAYFRKLYFLLAVTDKRVIIRAGIINLEISQIRYAQIESSEVASTIPGRLLGYSSVFINGTGGKTLAMPFVINATEIRNTVTEILSRRDDAEVH